LTGKTVDLRFRVDTGTPGAVHGSDLSGDNVRGVEAASPVTAFVTIAGGTRPIITHEFHAPTNPYIVIERYEISPAGGFANESLEEIYQLVERNDNLDALDIDSNQVVQTLTDRAEASARFVPGLDGDVETAPGSYVLTPDNYAFAYFSIRDFYYEDFQPSSGRPDQDYYREFASGRFTPTLLTVTVDVPGSAAPEPAPWALMILGFGALGGALRRSRIIHAV
jgi:hypothetical protein